MKNIQFLRDNKINIDNSLDIFGDIETYNETLDIFLEEAPNKFTKIKQFREIADMANYSILVHSLKSDAMYFGFDELSELSFNHELESKKNNIYYVSENFDVFEKEFNRIMRVVQVYKGLKENIEEVEILNVDKVQTVLVVDDSDVITNYLNKVLNREYKVLVAKDGKEAIDVIKENINIIYVLLDLNMPKVDGFAVLDYLKDNDLFEKLPVSIITSNELKEVDEKAKKYPIHSIIKKPFNERSIKKQIERISKG